MQNRNQNQNGYRKNSWSKENRDRPEIFLRDAPPQDITESRPATAERVVESTTRSGTKSFKELIVWQKSMALAKEIYAATTTFPREELYGLVSQLRRSAVSVPSGIAEGFRRRFQKELKPFLDIALGSLAELETQVAIAGELGYLKPETLKRLGDMTDQVIRMTIGLSKKT
ncbi:MAG TPA: four helix bundle protein [Candidatus Omnitrophota bacterium]|jgi:four helix bundle protein|nr:four helix bundle protein [Candidatus Omnitrophota bacterium]